jgi:hypothetical protein
MTTSGSTFGPVHARVWLDRVGAVREETRRARRALWFPLVLFGLVILASTPLYHSPGPSNGLSQTISGPGRWTLLGGMYVVTGLGLFAVLVATSLLGIFPIGELGIRGLTPLLALALSLFVLARVERSRALGAFAAGYLVLVVVANLYDMANVTSRLGFPQYGAQVNVVVVGSVLLLGGLRFGLGSRVQWRLPA